MCAVYARCSDLRELAQGPAVLEESVLSVEGKVGDWGCDSTF